MKIIIKLAAICSIILVPFFVKSQTINWDTLPYKQEADYKLAQLDKTIISTNILYDRVMPIADIERFKTQINTLDTSSPRHFAQAYYELFNCSYSTTNWITPDLLDSRLDTNKAEINAVPIGMLFYKYNTLDSNAYVDGLVDTLANGQLIDRQNRTRSPYFLKSTFIASPLISDNELFIEGENYTFYLDPEYFLKNEMLTITQIRIDFGDGQGEWIVNDPFSSNVQARGFFSKIVKTISRVLVGRITVVGVDILGHIIQYGNPFKILAKKKKIEYPLTACKGGKGGGRKWVIEPNATALAQQNAIYGNPPISYQQKVGRTYIDVKDTAYFFFKDDLNNCNAAVVRRPVIFIDGFDPNNDRKVGDIYKNYINKPVSRNGIPVFLADYMLDNGNSDPNDDLDFIILDFKHGNDLLERNAMTLVALIERLNATYGSNYLQDITLIGPSMGSLIAQYALAYMENKGIPHRVKTYISFDGNHQGANVPIGLQNYVEYITRRGILKNIKTIREGLYNGYGARQQLAHHHSANSQFPAPDAMRTQFLANLTVLSPTQYPQNCRKVALINGTNKGILNPYHGTNTDILSIDIKRKGIKSIWGLCNDQICKKIKWTARTATNNGSNRVAEMWTASPLYNTLFWLPLGKTNKYAQAAWGNSSQDNAPGGQFGELFSEDYETHATFLAKELIYLITGDKPNFNINLNNFTMMPSYSSADLQFPNKDLYMKWDDQYLCGKTPFDYVYAPPTNEEHVFVSPQGSVYFENEARCNRDDLPTFISGILGDYNLCTSGNFSLATCTPNVPITWSVTPAGAAIINPTVTYSNQPTNVIRQSPSPFTLTASVGTSACNTNSKASALISFGETVSQPSIEPYIPYPEATCYAYESFYYFQALTSNNSTSEYQWGYRLQNSSTEIVSNNTSYIEQFMFPAPGVYVIFVRVKAPCGIGYYQTEKTIDVKFECGQPQNFKMQLSPNPTSDLLSIKIVNEKENIKSSKSDFQTFQLFRADTKNKVREWKFSNTQKELNVSVKGLQNGVYILIAIRGEQKQSQLVMIK